MVNAYDAGAGGILYHRYYPGVGNWGVQKNNEGCTIAPVCVHLHETVSRLRFFLFGGPVPACGMLRDHVAR